MGCTDQSRNSDLRVDMTWEISKGSGMIQLNPLLPLDVLYSESHGSGDVGHIWTEHHQKFAEFINLYEPDSVLEIGGGHGILSLEYRRISAVDWTIVEPNPSPAKGVDANFIKGFFDDTFIFEERVGAIVHSHVFEHVYNPSDFISDISHFLQDGQMLIFSIPNMKEMLQRKYTNCLNFEHTIFITEPYVEYLLSRNGFRKIEKRYFKADHSIFYAYIKDSNVSIASLPEGLYESNKKIFLEYVNYHKNLIRQLNIKMEEISKLQSIYLFGAHIFAQYLIEFGLDTRHIVCILDNDANKQSKRLYGTSVMVASPRILEDLENPIIILKAGVYNKEIAEDILININSTAIFWE